MSTTFRQKHSAAIVRTREKRDYVSYSVFGPEQYWRYALKSLARARQSLPDWHIIVFYERHPAETPHVHRDKLLREFAGDPKVIFVPMTAEIKNHARLWRFLPIEYNDARCVIVRDIDSIITHAEIWCISHWLSTPHAMHAVHGCNQHEYTHLLAGLFGVRVDRFPPGFKTTMPAELLVAPIEHWHPSLRPMFYEFNLDELYLEQCWWQPLHNNTVCYSVIPTDKKFNSGGCGQLVTIPQDIIDTDKFFSGQQFPEAALKRKKRGIYN